MAKMRIEFPDARPDSTGGYLCHPDDAGNTMYVFTEDDQPTNPKPATARFVGTVQKIGALAG